MRFDPGRAEDTVRVYAPAEDGHWEPDSELGSLRMEIISRTTASTSTGRSDIDGARIAARTLHIGRARPSSLLVPGRIISTRGRRYHIDAVIEERDSFQPYLTVVLTEVQ